MSNIDLCHVCKATPVLLKVTVTLLTFGILTQFDSDLNNHSMWLVCELFCLVCEIVPLIIANVIADLYKVMNTDKIRIDDLTIRKK